MCYGYVLHNEKMFSEANNYAKLLTHVSNFSNRFDLSFPLEYKFKLVLHI